MMKKFFFITIFGFSTLLSQSVVSLDGSNDYLTTTETTGTKLEGDFTISGCVDPKLSVIRPLILDFKSFIRIHFLNACSLREYPTGNGKITTKFCI